MTGSLVAGLVAGYAVALPVGPVAVYLVALAARSGLRTGAAGALGVASADGLYALAAVLGGAAAAEVITRFAAPLRVASAVVLLMLAVRILRAGTGNGRRRAWAGPAPTPTGAYCRLLAVTLANPLTVISFTALVVGTRTRVDVGTARQVAFVLAVLAASASWQLLLAAAGSLLGRTMAGPRARLLTATTSGAVLAWLALRLVVPT